MIFSKGEKCPVCNREFQEEDDVVICPHCGTPHHRECYNELGHCANYQQHGSGFEYKAQTSQQDSPANDSPYYYNPENTAKKNKITCSKCGYENEMDTMFCKECGSLLDYSNVPKEDNPFTAEYKPPYEEDESANELIDGKRTKDVIATVRTNVKRFIPKFKKNKKLSWNWSAFIFGPYYFMFRKMYSEGILVMIARLVVDLVAQGIYADELEKLTNFVYSNQSALSNPTSDMIAQLVSYTQPLQPMIIITLAIRLVINICCALFADKAYRKKVFTIIDKVDKNLSEGGSFGQNSLFEVQTNLSQEQMKGLYLSKLGGTSIFAPIIAYMVLDLVTTLISKL